MKYLFQSIIALSIIALLSCVQEDLSIGNNILKTNDFLVSAIDSNSVRIEYTTLKDDSIRSTKITYMIGSMQYENGSKTKADFASRFYITGTDAPLESCTLDSVCVILYERVQFYGDTTKKQTLSIYELKNTLSKEHCQDYYAHATIPTDLLQSAEFIGSASYIPSTDTLNNFRFTIPHAKATEMFNNLAAVYSSSKNLQSIDSLFLQRFKGLYVTSDYADAAIINTYPQITFYMHESNGKQHTIDFAPSATPYTAVSDNDPTGIYMQALNMFSHDYSQEVKNTLGSTSSASYIQGFAGIKSTVKIKGLSQWKDSAVTFNSVKLIVGFTADTLKNYAPKVLPKLYVSSSEGVQLYALTADTTKTNVYQYNLNGVMSSIVRNNSTESDYIFEIAMPDNNVYGNMHTINNNSSQINITYTK